MNATSKRSEWEIWLLESKEAFDCLNVVTSWQIRERNKLIS